MGCQREVALNKRAAVPFLSLAGGKTHGAGEARESGGRGEVDDGGPGGRAGGSRRSLE